MAYDDLRDWIKALEKAGELRRIREEVSPELEITEITDRVTKSGGPALLFENIKGHPGHKVFINQFGSERRMALSLGVERLDEIAERIKGLRNVKAPEGLFDKLKMLPQLGALTSAFPKTVSAKRPAAKRSSSKRTSTSMPFRSSSAGRTTEAASSPCPASSPATHAPASATSECTACRSTTAKPPACTGSGRR